MRKKSLLTVAFVGVMVEFFAAGIYAGNKAPDVIKLKDKEYKKYTKGIVEFSHKKHTEEYAKKYPEGYKDGCGTCHHVEKDGKHVPRKDLKEGDDVERCIECHSKPGKKTKDAKNKLEFHAEAMHENCIGCHRDYDKANKTKDAPTSCSKCHPKK
jgi:hypothetical protein